MTLLTNADLRISSSARSPVRVMVVDDSAVARGFIRRWIETEPGIEIVASLRTGREAVDRLERADPDVVVLDVEMPDMDGITALPFILAKKPDIAVIMASNLTRRNAEVTMRALSLGALDCIQKPDAREAITSEHYRYSLITRIRELGARARRRPDGRINRTTVRPEARTAQVEVSPPRACADAIALRPGPAVPPRALVIGSSTGGPQALTDICGRLGAVIDQAPVLVAQHMPPTFTTILAEHLARATDRPAREAGDGEPIRPGCIYVAPGHRHLRVEGSAARPLAVLDDSPPIHFCKPAVDLLFSSAAAVWGPRVLGLILTGMGTDGTRGGADIVAAGGSLIAQDEATSIVWGMPGSVAQAGLCSSVLPLHDIAPALTRLFAGRAV